MGSMHNLIGGKRGDLAQIEIFEDYHLSMIFCQNLDGIPINLEVMILEILLR